MATAFPRTIIPRESTWPTTPDPLISVGHSGKLQVRSTLQVGREWTERYGPYLATSTTWRSWIAKVQHYKTYGIVLDVAHYNSRTLLGAGGGTPLVMGGSQTGHSLITDGWTGNAAILKAGDILTIAGLNPVYQITADVTAAATGTATLSISPAIPTGSAPADNAAITINSVAGSVTYRALLVSVRVSQASADGYEEGAELVFREAP